MNYQIITDRQVLEDFVHNFLPELKPNEKFYCCLFARNKYCSNLIRIKSDKTHQLKRFVSDKDHLISKIEQLEVKLGSYRQRDVVIPQEALALYITLNPRNMFKATINTMVKLANSIRDQNVSMNPQQEALSEIQKAKGTKHFIIADLDTKDESIIKKVESIVGKENLSVIQTRGGYHTIIRPSGIKDKFWYTKVSELGYCDQIGDIMSPVPGTYQGGFTPKFLVS